MNTIKKIITKQNKNLTNEQIEKIIEKSNYLEENAKNINNLINENLVNFNEVTQNLWYNVIKEVKIWNYY